MRVQILIEKEEKMSEKDCLIEPRTNKHVYGEKSWWLKGIEAEMAKEGKLSRQCLNWYPAKTCARSFTVDTTLQILEQNSSTEPVREPFTSEALSAAGFASREENSVSTNAPIITMTVDGLREVARTYLRLVSTLHALHVVLRALEGDEVSPEEMARVTATARETCPIPDTLLACGTNREALEDLKRLFSENSRDGHFDEYRWRCLRETWRDAPTLRLVKGAAST